MASKDKAKKSGEDEAKAGEGEGEEGAKPKKKLSPVKLAIFALAPLVLIGGGVGAAFFLGLFGKPAEEHAEAVDPHAEAAASEPKVDPAAIMFYDLPEVLVNLNSAGKGSTFLKLQVAIEIPIDAHTEEIDVAMPRILDKFQVFLRELRIEDLSGSTGTYRLKQELLRRVRLSGVHVDVHDVLIREMIIQ